MACLLVKQIDSLQKTYPYKLQLIIIDNGSTDNTVDKLRALKPKHIELIVAQELQKGPSFARNKGISIARYKYILFFDDDCILSSDIFSQYRRIWKKEPELDLIGGPIEVRKEDGSVFTASERTKLLQHPWCFGELSYEASRQLQLGELLYTANLSAKKNSCLYFSRFLGIRYSKFATIYAEDYELCSRYLLSGRKVYYDSNLRVTNLIHPDRFSAKYRLKRYWLAAKEMRILDLLFSNQNYSSPAWQNYTSRCMESLKGGYATLRQLFSNYYDIVFLISYLYHSIIDYHKKQTYEITN
jgi:glycosyltransferase involved in cell wall biosynthesis